MSSLSILSRRYRSAILLGLAATIAFHLPPFDLAARANGKIFDLWSRLRAPDAPADILIVSLEDPAWFPTLADIAHRGHSRLLVSTLAQPPTPLVNEWSLGPTELVLGNQLLRRTDWRKGGHLWFETQPDGVVRQDATFIGDVDRLPSLGFAAATALAARDDEPGAERWVRFFAADSFARLSPDDVLAAPGRLAHSVVIAGRSEPSYATPLGSLPARDLLAHIVAGYREGIEIRTSLMGTAAAWLLASLGLVATPASPRRLARWRSALPAAGAGGVLALSAAAFYGASLWIPPAAPLVLLLVGGALIAVRPRRQGGKRDAAANLDEARGALADGDLDRAWRLYRGMPPTAMLRDELYELGHALQHSDSFEQAADTFHRIAVVDAHFRDVAQRLVAATRTESPQVQEAPQIRGAALATIGRYEILATIGQGSTGKVFLGRDPKINRLLAIKVIDLTAEFETADLVDAADRFRREAETAGRLNHPNIVTVFDIGEAQGLAYIAMEYLKGRHLSDFAEGDALLPPQLVLELAAQTADALHYAHAQNVVHRDIKPANIMYDSVSGSLKITDFGIARLIDVSRTRTGIVLGTPSFMAPEQLEGRNVNGHTDLFALGVSVYQLLTGRLPFRGASMTKLMFVIANEPHQPITKVRQDLPEQSDALIDTALAKDPVNRFQSGAEMADALRAVAAHMG